MISAARTVAQPTKKTFFCNLSWLQCSAEELIDTDTSKERVWATLRNDLRVEVAGDEKRFVKISQVLWVTAAAMTAFAGNSIICRLALQRTLIDPASFTLIRLASGAAALAMLLVWRRRGLGVAKPRNVALAQAAQRHMGGSWRAAAILMLYAASFSYAYSSLPAGAGALLLFGAVQLTMILSGWLGGERMTLRQAGGLLLATAGLVAMMVPGLSAPPLAGALLMLTSGVAWAAYSLFGRGSADPFGDTAGNFIRAVPLSIALSLATLGQHHIDVGGAGYAVLSGVVTSGFGYILWYHALRQLGSTQAASVQLIVPVLASLGGIVFLDELLPLRLLAACIAILGGVALVMAGKRPVVVSVTPAVRQSVK